MKLLTTRDFNFSYDLWHISNFSYINYYSGNYHNHKSVSWLWDIYIKGFDNLRIMSNISIVYYFGLSCWELNVPRPNKIWTLL